MTRPRIVSSGLVVAVVATLVITGLVIDAVAGGGRTFGPTDAEVPLLAGSSTCAAMQLGGESQVTATTVAAPVEPEADELAEGAESDDGAQGAEGSNDAAALDVPGGPAALLRLDSDGRTRSLAEPAVDGGVVATTLSDGAASGAVTVRWHEAPTLLSRRWGVDSTQRVPGTVEGPCPAEPGTDWVVPGVATAGGAAAQLFLANPTDGSASLAVSFTTPDGPVAPTRLANLAVPAHGQVTVDLNEFMPEEPDLGVVVSTRAGRVVAEVVQSLEAAVGGVDGRSLVVATPTLAEVWTIPWVTAGEQESGWIWVTNPGDEATDVRLVVHTEAGPTVPPDSGVTLPPGATRRIDLRGALAEVGTAAVTVRSAPGVPIAASGGVLRAVEDDAVRGGVAVVEALQAGRGPHAALSAVGATGLQRRLALANPGDIEAVVAVSVVGRSVAATRQVSSGLRIPPGTSLQLDLDGELPLEGGFAVVVDATEGTAVAALVTESAEGPLDLTAVAARRFPTTVTIPRPTAVVDRSLLHPVDRGELVDDPTVDQREDDPVEDDPDTGLVTDPVSPAPDPGAPTPDPDDP